MSFFPGKDPQAGNTYACEAIAHVVVPRTVDLGDGFSVRRALPSARSRMVGPFIFFDHFGPAEFRAGNGLDVRPHPHIGLATVTYLFDGEIMHRDSLGTAVAIKPGEVNWMTAGRGIVHSERTGAEKRAAGGPIHGLQMWVALPAAKEEMDAGFAHHDTDEFPMINDDDAFVRVIVGSLYGKASPVPTVHDTLFANIALRDDQGRDRRAFRHPRRRADGRPAPHLVEFRVIAERTHRAGQGRVGRRPFRQGAGRRNRVHSAAGEMTRMYARGIISVRPRGGGDTAKPRIAAPGFPLTRE
jgi:redox-sensitive bicupin YhaK (pirin superfamily)